MFWSLGLVRLKLVAVPWHPGTGNLVAVVKSQILFGDTSIYGK